MRIDPARHPLNRCLNGYADADRAFSVHALRHPAVSGHRLEELRLGHHAAIYRPAVIAHPVGEYPEAACAQASRWHAPWAAFMSRLPPTDTVL